MSAALLLTVVAGYFLLLFGVARWAARRGGAADNDSFFIGNRRSPWLLVAFGMIGTSLSGVTFISVPGSVGAGQFGYLQIALGQFVGYALIAFVLLPLYYALRVTSIYELLAARLGGEAQRSGALFFVVSRLLGATARLYLVGRVLHDGVLQPLVPFELPFAVTAAVLVGVVFLYTIEGGVKAIVWTDTLQTSGMLIGLLASAAWVLQALQMDIGQAWTAMGELGLNRVWQHDPDAPNFWAKQLLAGVAIAVAMTGLDQEMMQKNLSVPRLADAQRNVLLMSTLMLGVVFLFLWLGGLLHLFAARAGLAAGGDALFPAVVLGHLPLLAQVVFVLALVSALAAERRWGAHGTHRQHLPGPAAQPGTPRGRADPPAPPRAPPVCAGLSGPGAAVPLAGRPEHDPAHPQAGRLHLRALARPVPVRAAGAGAPPASRRGAARGLAGAAGLWRHRRPSGRLAGQLPHRPGDAAAQRLVHLGRPVARLPQGFVTETAACPGRRRLC
jgi:Na+/pantothenate symporter